MTDTPLDVQRAADGCVTLTLDRAERHNALDAELIDRLHTTIDELSPDASVRAIVLTGRGRTFSAGADLNWMRAQFSATRAARLTEARRLADMLFALNGLPVPVIARVQGSAFGGGVGLLCCCDHVIASERCRFAFTETRLGLVPATIGPFVTARIGESAFRSHVLMAERLGTDEARRIGLIDEAVEADALDARVQAVVAALLAGAPRAAARAKRLARRLGAPIDDTVLAACCAELADCWEDTEAVDRIGAFLDRADA